MKGSNTGQEAADGVSRRAVLATAGTAGAVSLAGCGILGGGSDGNGGEDDDAVTVGVSIPQDGIQINTGEFLEDGYRLAAEHINNGAGATTVEPWGDIGEGVLGQELQLEFEDTSSTSDGARQSAQVLLEDGVDAITGGGSAREGIGLQQTVEGEDVVYLGGYTPLGALWSQYCSDNVFNEVYTPGMAATALREYLTDEFGTDADITVGQLLPDNEFGDELSQQVRTELLSIGRSWSHNRAIETSQNIRSFEGPVSDILATGANLIVLNYTGRTAASALAELRAQDPSVDVVVPIIDGVAARNAGDALEDVIGTTPWHAQLTDDFSRAFFNSWGDIDTNKPQPSDIAFVAYVQLCQYVAAAERAGSVEPDAVRAELEGYSYSFGDRTHELRACDESVRRDVPVVTGLPGDQQSAGLYLQGERIVTT
jgi:branched-chain amino acid transport system substrate-binding protein